MPYQYQIRARVAVRLPNGQKYDAGYILAKGHVRNAEDLQLVQRTCRPGSAWQVVDVDGAEAELAEDMAAVKAAEAAAAREAALQELVQLKGIGPEIADALIEKNIRSLHALAAVIDNGEGPRLAAEVSGVTQKSLAAWRKQIDKIEGKDHADAENTAETGPETGEENATAGEQP